MADTKKPPTPRRRIWEAAQRISLGRTYTKKELDALIDPVEARMTAQWYDSDETDFSFYSEPDYIYILLRSWETSSAGNCDFLIRNGLFLPDMKSAFDYHGGMGLTALRLAMAYPHVQFYSHTVVPQHAEWCSRLAEELDVRNVEAIDRLVPSDVLIAQETLEHLQNPWEEMDELLRVVQPRQYLDGSSFGVDNPGHFRNYVHRGEVIPRAKARQFLTRYLHENGFDPYWKRREGYKHPYNGRPALYDGPGEFVSASSDVPEVAPRAVDAAQSSAP
jgi:hypothetical protein